MNRIINICLKIISRGEIAVLSLFVILISCSYAQMRDISDLNLSNSKSSASSYLLERSHLPAKRYPPQKLVKSELILSPYFGFSLPLQELKGELSQVSLNNFSTSVRTYYAKYGFSLGLTAKLPVGKDRNFRPKLTAVYNWFMNSGTDSSGNFTVEPFLSIFQMGLGAEYVVLTSGDIRPYVEFDFMANVFSGSVDYTSSVSGLAISYNYNRNVRYGISGGAGVEYSISKDYSLLGGVKYNMANLLGKDYDDTGAHDLNDAAFTIDGFNIAQKNISFISFYIGAALNIRD